MKQIIFDESVNVELIYEFLILNHLTKREFCKKYNFSYSVLIKILKKQINYGCDSLLKLARILNVEICELFNRYQ